MKPCKECPFSRQIAPGFLGGARPEVYVGQIVLPFWLSCHCDTNYKGRESKAGEVTQCAGAAIFRSNMGIRPPPPLLCLPPSDTLSFTTLPEFYAHHTGCSIEAAKQYLTHDKVRECFIQELNDSRLKAQLIPKLD